MSLFTRLKCNCALERCIRLNWAPKSRCQSLKNSPNFRPPTRSFFLRILRKPSQTDLKKADDIPESFALIYRNTMSKYILGAQIVSLVTGGAVLLTFLLNTDYRDYRRDSLKWSSGSRRTEHEEYYYITIFLVILVLMQVMISRIPIRIYKVPRTDKYIGINYGNYMFGKEKYSFRRGQIFQTESRGILPWRDNKYFIESKDQRRSVILVDYFFRRPADLSIMLGEQRDPEVDEEEGQAKSK